MANDDATRELEGEMGKAFYADVVRLEDENKKLRDDLSKLFDEKRMWKARAEAAIAYVKVLAIDLPLAMRLSHVIPPNEAMASILADIRVLQEKHDAVLADAWTQTTRTAKDFVKEFASSLEDPHPDAPWIVPWVRRFKAALGD